MSSCKHFVNDFQLQILLLPEQKFCPSSVFLLFLVFESHYAKNIVLLTLIAALAAVINLTFNHTYNLRTFIL